MTTDKLQSNYRVTTGLPQIRSLNHSYIDPLTGFTLSTDELRRGRTKEKKKERKREKGSQKQARGRMEQLTELALEVAADRAEKRHEEAEHL
ncbi:hypothetical protein, partial [Salmonella enterica]|uniref:hypothetical protein n=1 Tax=Salmonella enterica TaxID=28901 RepID=UPI001EE98F20